MNHPQTELDHTTEGHAIPIPHVQAAINAMDYASPVRVMFQMLYYTGCRIQELDRMQITQLHGTWIYWQLSKNQTGKYRKEQLPETYLQELATYRETHRVYANRLFGITGETFRDYFKKITRHHLPTPWQRKRPYMTQGAFKLEYIYQLKGLRKNFQTLAYKKELNEWGDPGLAIEMTSKRMRHSSMKITARHYVENFRALGVNTLPTLDPATLLHTHQQRRILDYT